MAEENIVYDFGDHVTTSEELAEIFYCLKKIEPALEFSENETVDSLVEKQMAVSGYASRMKSSVLLYLEKKSQAEIENVPEDSYAGRIIRNLNEMKKKTFYFREKALQLPAGKIKANLQEAALLAGSLPSMVAALDAGEDEVR